MPIPFALRLLMNVLPSTIAAKLAVPSSPPLLPASAQFQQRRHLQDPVNAAEQSQVRA